MTAATHLVWLRNDLRIADNPALAAAADGEARVVACFVLDEHSPGLRPLGGASRWWLHHSLTRLAEALDRRGIALVLRRGAATDVVPALARALGATRVDWSRRYGGAEIAVDKAVKARLRQDGIEAASHNGALLYEPWTVKTKTGEFFKVFTPFARSARAGGEPAAPPPALVPRPIAGRPTVAIETDSLDDWRLLPRAPDWAGGLRATWQPGEDGAIARLAAFLDAGLRGYADGRDRPDQGFTSRLSPHLAFGEISPRTVWHAAAARLDGLGGEPVPARDVEKFHSELMWREFSHHLLYHRPDLATVNFQPRFDHFPWNGDPAALARWQAGQTGYPIVDAGMRQLWQTGYMHNRVRMIVGSLLVKHLLIDWRAGERWFWDTLVDADAANNAAGWQWIAGSGADAAPYFRVFNPILQGEKFDPDGAYVARYVPELARLPASVIQKPWTASPQTLHAAGVRLGESYPRPVVDHDKGRARALAAFAALQDA
ncbi:MAG: deoxyribodipyrimidine photo-lyase [Hyphomicrobiaceae bacterium]|nr:deoxyribodipyrimidine photo-lyase [Hyphomicrobiaceae bacterium]